MAQKSRSKEKIEHRRNGSSKQADFFVNDRDKHRETLCQVLLVILTKNFTFSQRGKKPIYLMKGLSKHVFVDIMLAYASVIDKKSAHLVEPSRSHWTFSLDRDFWAVLCC